MAATPTTIERARPKTAIFFPGQGVQKVGMLTPWLEAFPRTAGQTVEEIDACMGYRLSQVIQEGPGQALTATAHAQPAIMATSILIVRVLEREFGFRVSERTDVALGHSLGEFAALVAAGYLGFADSLRLVRRRAEVMAEATKEAQQRSCDGEYGMVAVVTEPEYLGELVRAIERCLQGSPLPSAVHIANINSKNQIVLSGNIGQIKEVMVQVRQFFGHDPRAVRLSSDSPFHSPIMRPAVMEMRKMLAQTHVSAGMIPCISNVTARPFGSEAELKDLLARQCEETVLWWDSIRYLDQEQRVRRWVGIGPGKVGRNLVGKEVGMRGKDMVKGGGVWAITDPSEIEEVLRGLEETESFVDEEAEKDGRIRYYSHRL